jgi:hypothetical protein
MADPAQLTTVYASDEDVAVRAMGDYAALCPDSSMVAYGTDGRFVSNDLWTLRSVLVPFTTNGVAVGNVVRLVKPETTYKGGGTLMAVSSVAANALTLRRIGQSTGEGQAPGPVGGLTSITFECKTFGPQIEQVSYDLNQQYGIDPDISFVGPTALADIRQLRQACVLTVLMESYIIANRTYKGDFDLKIEQYKTELERTLGFLKIRWTSRDREMQPITRFGTRMARG